MINLLYMLFLFIFYLTSSGSAYKKIFSLSSNSFSLLSTSQGPQGFQGSPGEAGEPGQAVSIRHNPPVVPPQVTLHALL